jgi:CHAD domain-containing protein
MAGGRKIEVETKYQVRAPGAADRYLVAPDIGPFSADGRVRSIRIEDRYVDSADWAIGRAGFAARLRKGSAGTVIGLKSLGLSNGRIQRREEIEGPANGSLNPADWPPSRARTMVLKHTDGSELVEMLTIRQLRRTRTLRSGNTRAELSVDEVEVLCDGRILDAFEELEVELKKGGEGPMAELASVFDRNGDLRPASRSKLERAIELVADSIESMPAEIRERWRSAPAEMLAARPGVTARTTQPGPETAPDAASVNPSGPSDPPPATDALGPRTLGIVGEDSLSEAAQKVLRFHFARMQYREAGTRSGLDAEDLHDMRVATRRLRAAWRVFEGAYKAGKTKKIRRHLESIADRLGVVRDLDVLIAGLHEYRLSLDDEHRPGLEPLLTLWQRQRDKARDALVAELDSESYSAFIKEMAEFLEAGANAAANVIPPTSPHRVRDRAASQIWAAYEAVRAYEPLLSWADMETLHELRIASKWLRYTLEFFNETLGRDGGLLLGRVTAVQDHLGSLHDADAAAKLARDLLVAKAAELTKLEADTIGAYLRTREREVARLRHTFRPLWRAISGAPFRRALGRAAAAL